jgi:hypothetical protein
LNSDGAVDAADNAYWNSQNSSPALTVDEANSTSWVENVGNTVSESVVSGTIPEPSTSLLLFVALLALGAFGAPGFAARKRQ